MPCNKTCIFQQMIDSFKGKVAELENELKEVKEENLKLLLKNQELSDELYNAYIGDDK